MTSPVPSSPVPRITDEQVALLPLGRARAELMEEIISTPTTSAPSAPEIASSGDRPVRSHHAGRRWAVVVGAAAAIALTVAVPVWVGSRSDVLGRGPAASTSGAPSGPSPYVVLTAPGWKVAYVDGAAAGGEIHYRRGGRELDVAWVPAQLFADRLKDRQHISATTPVTVLGQPSSMWAYDRTDHTAIRPVQGGTFLEIRGQGMSRASYLDLLGDLRPVDAQGFGATLPASVVRPDAVARTVSSMLAGVGTPPGFDVTSIEVPAYQSRYGVAEAVTSAVGCAWLDRYAAAQTTGDTASQREAVTAMRGSRRWPVLESMASDGGWSSVFWLTARDMAAGRAASELRPGLGC